MAKGKKNDARYFGFWAIALVAFGLWLGSCSFNHINHPTATCGGEQMTGGSSCVHYRNGSRVGASNADEERSDNKGAGYLGVAVAGVVLLLGGGAAYLAFKRP